MMFYLNVFYVPTLKQVVGQHKMWNEVKFCFTQIFFTLSCRLKYLFVGYENGRVTISSWKSGRSSGRISVCNACNNTENV